MSFTQPSQSSEHQTTPDQGHMTAKRQNLPDATHCHDCSRDEVPRNNAGLSQIKSDKLCSNFQQQILQDQTTVLSFPTEILCKIASYLCFMDQISLADVFPLWQEVLATNLSRVKELMIPDNVFCQVFPYSWSTGPPSGAEWYAFVEKRVRYLSNVEVLQCVGVDNTTAKIIASKCPNIKTLLFRSVKLGPSSLKQFAVGCRFIETLELDYVPFEDDGDLTGLFKVCKIKKFTLLTHNDVNGFTFWKHASSLTYLELRLSHPVAIPELTKCDNLVELEIWQQTDHLPPGLEILRVRYLGSIRFINDMDWITAVFDSCSKLFHLDINGNISQSFLDKVLSNPHITVLKLNIPSLPGNLNSLSDSKVEKLSISNWPVVTDDLVSEIFRRMKCLRVLDIWRCSQVTQKAFDVLLEEGRVQQPEVHISPSHYYFDSHFLTENADRLNIVTDGSQDLF